MSTLIGTTGSTCHALQHPSIFGLGAGSVPTTLQQPTANIQASLTTVVGLTLATMLGGIGLASNELPPTFAETARYITPARIIERRSSVLLGYETSQSQDASVNEYLRQHISSRNFLHDVAIIIDNIYGSKVIRDIYVVEDVDTGKPIMELTIKSGLPLDDEFIQKDELLFQRIEASGLAWGLRDVVISQG